MDTGNDNPLDRVASFLAEQRDIRLGIVFGSVARRRATAESDLDVAVLADRSLTAERRMSLMEGLSMATGRPVDLVDLRSSGIPVVRSALLEGRVVFSRDGASYPEQAYRMLVDSADFMPYRIRSLKERREAWIK